jgi:pyridoxamine 5'-phosphate oxidase
MVLLKDYSENGFKFFTNYNSKKGQELESNPYASMCFYWEAVSRQVRVDGKVHRITSEESLDYFNKRPLNSRISAYISEQSNVIKNRGVLVDDYQKALTEYGTVEKKVPKPENWGGYLLVPDEFEFWQGNDIRLHDRLRFRKQKEGEVINFGEDSGVIQGDDGWIIERLAP